MTVQIQVQHSMQALQFYELTHNADYAGSCSEYVLNPLFKATSQLIQALTLPLMLDG